MKINLNCKDETFVAILGLIIGLIVSISAFILGFKTGFIIILFLFSFLFGAFAIMLIHAAYYSLEDWKNKKI